ncbi:MAG: hypothetical protein K2Y30_01835 [Flavobacteriaceae bacterium]|nr:hypothetical protein [Flavobacteriaceae bacterium]
MYSYHEIRKIFARCKDWLELEKAAQAFIMVIEDGDMNEQQMAFTRKEVDIRFRQLKV